MARSPGVTLPFIFYALFFLLIPSDILPLVSFWHQVELYPFSKFRLIPFS